MSWRDTALARRLGVALPIVQAPMAGGISTPRLAAAVSAAGGLGSIAGAMLSPDELRAAIREVRALTGAPFAVNLFAPLPAPSTDRVAEWRILTSATAPPTAASPARTETPTTAPPTRTEAPTTALPAIAAPRFEDQLAVTVDERVPVLSYTFGIPTLSDVDTITIGTATTVAEALALERAGATAVVVQGFEAGGHRGTFLDPVERSLVGTLALVPQVVDAVSIPVVAAGGIMDGRGIAAALTLGAQAVQLGTAFMRCPESGTSRAHRDALDRETTITRVLTGRHARAVRTPLVDRLEASGAEPPDYPLPRFMSPEPPMLAGQGGPLARALPAVELMTTLAAETDAAISAPGG